MVTRVGCVCEKSHRLFSFGSEPRLYSVIEKSVTIQEMSDNFIQKKIDSFCLELIACIVQTV